MSDERARFVTAAFEEGRRAWQEVTLSLDQFAAYVAEHAPECDTAPARGADLYLACACSRGDADALAAFERTCLSDVPLFLSRSGATKAFVDEVCQRLRERLFVDLRILQYSGRGSLTSWLRVVTLRVAADLRRQESPGRALDDALPAADVDPELGVIKARYGEAFREALRDVLTELEAEHRSLLRLHFVDGLNTERLGTLFGVSRATMGRRVLALRRRLLTRTRELLGARLGATPDELESLLRLVRSDLAITLSTILGKGGASKAG